MARQEGDSITKGLKLFKPIKLAHWVNFVRHHDELNLELLNDTEKEEVWEAFAPEENMRLFGHGIRRRLPPMLKNDMARMKIFYVINFSLPGTPLISYGEEIGMGDDLSLDGRDSVRTSMQWNAEPNAGFSTAPKERLYRPAVNHGEYDYRKINIIDHQKDPDSLLNWLCSLIRIRKQCPVIGSGEWYIMEPLDKRVAAIFYKGPESMLMVVFNLSNEELHVKILSDIVPKRMTNIYQDSYYEGGIDINNLNLKPFGYRWIQVLEKEEVN